MKSFKILLSSAVLLFAISTSAFTKAGELWWFNTSDVYNGEDFLTPSQERDRLIGIDGASFNYFTTSGTGSLFEKGYTNDHLNTPDQPELGHLSTITTPDGVIYRQPK